MTTKTFDVLTCDRCGAVVEDRTGTAQYDWATLLAKEVNGPFRIGETPGHGPSKPVDLCPTCKDSLKGWWPAGRVS